MDPLGILNLVLVILILILACVFLITAERCNEPFQNPKEKYQTWKQRLRELKLIPKLYLDYFKPNKINNVISSPKPNQIFISVASYRDDQCSDTILNISENADHPESLHFFICQQNGIFDEDCLNRCRNKTKSTINIERLHSDKARGPTWARYRIQQHWSGEEFYLQIDSHTRLIKSWDTILKNQLNMCPNPDKSILSQYPLEYDNVPIKDRRDPEKEKWRTGKLRSGLYIQKIGPEGFTRIQSDYTTDIRRQPFKGIGWAAGFSFSKGSFVADVPIDPYLYLFFGEQMDIAIRAYTHGYDIYSPTMTIAYHIYDRSHRKTFWELVHQKPLEVLSRFRLYVKLGMIGKHNIPKEFHGILIDLERYSLGTERTLEEYEKEANIDIKEETLFNQ